MFVEMYRPMLKYASSVFPNMLQERYFDIYSLTVYAILLIYLTLYYPYFLRDRLKPLNFYKRIREVL
jgi:hypothetical protein